MTAEAFGERLWATRDRFWNMGPGGPGRDRFEQFNSVVRAFVTIALTLAFLAGFLLGHISGTIFATIYGMVVAFWFGDRQGERRVRAIVARAPTSPAPPVAT